MASDSFTNSDGTALSTHDSNWVDVDSTYNVGNLEINSNRAEGTGVWVLGGAIYSNGQGADQESEMVLVGGGNQVTDDRHIGCRMDNGRTAPATRGYSALLGGGDGTEWDTVFLNKSGGWLATVTTTGGPWAYADDHTIKLTVSGSSTVTLSVEVDSSSVGSDKTDSSSPHTDGEPGFYINDSGTIANYRVDDWTDNEGGGAATYPKNPLRWPTRGPLGGPLWL